MRRLREWALDWIDRSGTEAADAKIDEPLSLLQRIFTIIAGFVAIFSSPAINFLAPNLNANAAMVLRIIVVIAALAAVNYVVVAKTASETVSGMGVRTLRKYRFSTTERLIARGVVVIALIILALNFVPAPKEPRDCAITANLAWQTPQGTARPSYLSLMIGGREQRYPVAPGKPIAIQIPAAHISKYSMALQWSDNSRSDFGEMPGCMAGLSKASSDGRVTINLQGR